VSGVSPKEIARRLNRGDVPGPFGSKWSPSTIHGHHARGTGILNNELYVGRLVWNRLRYIKNPDTGRRVSRPNPRSEWVTVDVPSLCFVDDELWAAVKERQERTRRKLSQPAGAALSRLRRPRYVFSSLTRCGECGAGFITQARNRLGCFGASAQGTCTNRLTIRRDEVEQRVLKALQENLLRKAERLEARRAKLVESIMEGVPGSQVKDELIAIAACREELARQLEAAGQAPPLLHPSMADLYRQKVTSLAQALEHPDSRAEATETLRGLIRRNRAHAGGRGAAHRIEGKSGGDAGRGPVAGNRRDLSAIWFGCGGSQATPLDFARGGCR